MQIRRWMRFLEPGALCLLFLGASVAPCFAQSAHAAPADSASRAAAVYQQGMSALQNGDLGGARAAFEKVLRLAPQSPEGHNSLGWVLLAQGEIDPAISQFRTVVRLKHDFAQAHINLSNALARKGDLSAALSEAQEATRLAPSDSETHHTLGRVLDFSRDFDGAARPAFWAMSVKCAIGFPFVLCG